MLTLLRSSHKSGSSMHTSRVPRPGCLDHPSQMHSATLSVLPMLLMYLACLTRLACSAVIPMNLSGQFLERERQKSEGESKVSLNVFMSLTIANIESGSPKMWLHFVLAYAFVIWALFLLHWHYQVRSAPTSGGAHSLVPYTDACPLRVRSWVLGTQHAGCALPGRFKGCAAYTRCPQAAASKRVPNSTHQTEGRPMHAWQSAMAAYLELACPTRRSRRLVTPSEHIALDALQVAVAL